MTPLTMFAPSRVTRPGNSMHKEPWRSPVSHSVNAVALVLTRQGTALLDVGRYPGVAAGLPLGGYILSDSTPDALPDIVLIAIGGEAHLALAGRDQLAKEGVHARVVSMPSECIFSKQPEQYRDEVLPPGVPLVTIKPSASVRWRSIVRADDALAKIEILSASTYGQISTWSRYRALNDISENAHALLKQSNKDE